VEGERNGAHPYVGNEGPLIARTLNVEGRLDIAGEGGERIDVFAAGSVLRAEVGSYPVRRPTLRLVRSSMVLARRLSIVLEAQGLTLVVTRAGKPLAELGAGVMGGIAARMLRMPRVRLFRRT
jgi:hypothetical protein